MLSRAAHNSKTIQSSEYAGHKMVASYVMKAVTLTRDYGIQIEFNISEAQYLGGRDMG